jgi:exosortase/archaeosortase family protein
MRQKKVFNTIIAIFVVLLMILPFLVSFNEVLTGLFQNIRAYVWIQEKIVPPEVSMVGALTSIIGIHITPYTNGMIVKGTFLEMTWNCIGWQSLLFLFITLAVGLGSGSYTAASKIEVILIGILGTFWVNLIRLTIIVAVFVYLRPFYFYFYHDYFAAVVIILWLSFLWWFSYKHILREKRSNDAK